MEKSHAFELLGGTAASVARQCRITPSAVSQWPDVLTKDQVDRVQAALWRKHVAAKSHVDAQPSQEPAHG